MDKKFKVFDKKIDAFLFEEFILSNDLFNDKCKRFFYSKESDFIFCQYIDAKDKNERSIYELDIVKNYYDDEKKDIFYEYVFMGLGGIYLLPIKKYKKEKKREMESFALGDNLYDTYEIIGNMLTMPKIFEMDKAANKHLRLKDLKELRLKE